MGELIKVVGDIRVKKSKLKIEINGPSGSGGSEEIHLQNEFFRYSLPKEKFLKFAFGILEAERQYRWLKGLKNE